ncbi:S8 family peptidase [Brevibacillus fulvus]|uniref:Subtilisin family serine protease n=1 Tax=Brevibacillus fulvus TaxID=1125967 RepID=A0A939BV01_9BACL|nr:subtilisin family serine protease [Brevibacillus fulvus]
MHKLITLPTRKAYHFCLSCLEKEAAVKQKAKVFGSLRTLVVPEEHVETLCKMFGKQKHVVSDNVRIRLHMAEEIPWGVESIGAPKYWSTTKGQGVKVAVIDTGISRTHPDLQGQVKGRVIFANNGRGYKQIDGHGTHVAGTIAAVANQKGIVGVAPAVELYDVRVFAPDGTASTADIVEGLNWAVENKMDIVNMSFGTTEDNYALRHAIQQAHRAGIVLVASAGNNGGKLEYPAAYKGVVAVGAVDRKNSLAEFSSRGKGLDVLAPGVGIKSTWLNNEYKVLDGTSMAAAHVSGLYALMLSQKRRQSVRSLRKQLSAKR